MSKTLLIFEEVPERIRLKIVDGDYRHLNGVYINSDSDRDKQKELSSLVHDEDGSWIEDENSLSPNSPLSVEWFFTHGVEHIVFCGFYL